MEFSRRGAIGAGAAAGIGLIGVKPVYAKTAAGQGSGAANLRVCGIVAPLALGGIEPRFSWEAGENIGQSAYRIMVAANETDLAAGRNLLWDSGKVISRRSFDIAYGGPVLPPRARAVWQVRVWPLQGGPSRQSLPAAWETGLGETPAWSGRWLACETETARLDRQAGIHWIIGSGQQKANGLRFFRQVLDKADHGPAELLVSANKCEGVWFNGELLEAKLDGPVSWTSMTCYPVELKPGRNIIAVAVRRLTGFGVAPPDLAVIIRSGDGLNERSATVDGWKSSLDAPDGWQLSGFDDSGWEAATPATRSLPIGEPWPVYPANLLRRKFTVGKSVRSARLYATALGVYEPFINGGKVGTHRLAPEFTDASKHVLYQAYDVTGQIKPGDNVLGFWVGDGWYGSKFSTSGRFAFGPAPCRMLAQLEIAYADGTLETIGTGDGWTIAESAIRASSIYDGEVFDARLDQTDWSEPGKTENGWRPADTIETPPIPTDPQRCPPVRAHEILYPRTVTKLRSGVYVVDFGQNFAGWPRLSVNAPAGARIEMRFAELLKSTGEVDQANLRTAWQRDVYITAGKGREIWEPRFTYHGFRYVELSGVPDNPANWSLEALVGYQDLPITGDFRCADSVVRKFWENSVWSQKSNFFGLPTDCPQRDERLGWMGDAEVFWPAAAFNMDVGAYTGRVMTDMRRGQQADGAFPDCIPPFVPTMNLSSPGWADAGVVLPYTAWQQYGDTGVIAANWDAMDRYLGRILSHNPNHIWSAVRGADYGDWLAVDAPAANPGLATTPKDLIATAYWAGDAAMMAQMAAAIGKPAEAARFGELFTAIRTAFNAAFVKADGGVGNGSQTSYVVAISYGLLSAPLQAIAGRRLAADIARRANTLSTGFLGTPHILDALAMAGQEAMAITLLLQRAFPSWGYMVTKGATTMWERWNSDGGDVGMNSRNHYAFGAIGAFLFRRIAGIAPAAPGFATVKIAPIIDQRIGNAGATYHSAAGTIRTDWKAGGSAFTLDVELPAGVRAEVSLPDSRNVAVTGGLHRFSGALKRGAA